MSADANTRNAKVIAVLAGLAGILAVVVAVVDIAIGESSRGLRILITAVAPVALAVLVWRYRGPGDGRSRD